MNSDIRLSFPSLKRKHNGKPLIFLDGPAGVQVPATVIDAISKYYRNSNANTHGAFITARETDNVVADARIHMSDFLGAEGPSTISFGQNMTSLNYSLSRALGKTLLPGDEILITQLDHEANRGPWLALRANGIVVREVRLLKNGQLDYEDFQDKINERTRVVAMGIASNILGTINDVMQIRHLTYQVGALLVLDAVHYAPHFALDVQELGCDFLLCSAYKFYGPHVGILYSKPGLLDQLPTDRLRTTDQFAPYSIETGTLNHAALAGVCAAVQFIASQGDGGTLRELTLSAMEELHAYEIGLARQLYFGLSKISAVQIHGPIMSQLRAPTISFTVRGKTAAEVCRLLANENICAWDGHFYAIRATEVLGLLEKGGVVRMGIAMYNTTEEIEQTIEEVRQISES